MNIVVDLDGTIAAWGVDHARCGEWIDGAAEALRELRASGHSIVVHSCRATWEAGGGVREIARFLRSGGFVPFVVKHQVVDGRQMQAWHFVYPDGEIKDVVEMVAAFQDERIIGIWTGVGKPIGHVYIDDRAIQFTGSWPETMQRIEEGAFV